MRAVIPGTAAARTDPGATSFVAVWISVVDFEVGGDAAAVAAMGRSLEQELNFVIDMFLIHAGR
jgi:hypothetical protein